MFIDYIKSGFRNLLRRGLRSFLTVLSIAIGTGSVVLISSIGDLGKQTINSEIDSLGLGSISVSVNSNASANLSLNHEGLEIIENQDCVDSALPILMEYSELSMRGLRGNCMVWGIGSGAKQVIQLDPVYGRLINQSDLSGQKKVCVLDQNTAKLYYGRENIVGKTASIQTQTGQENFEIIGIVRSGGALLQNMISDLIPSFLYIPYTTAQTCSGKSGFDQIAVKIAEDFDPDTCSTMLTGTLARELGVDNEFRVDNIAKQKDTLNHIMNLVSMVLSAIALISLLVAGLGIMTVMLVSVNERTREIGIKKSIGATSRKILLEFMIEAFMISIVGGIIGITSGITITAVGCAILNTSFVLNWQIIWETMILSVTIGLLFGVYPARMAGKLRPVDALKFD